MEKDKMIEALFADYKPEIGDTDRFMASLERRLDAVEYIKKMQEAQLRRYKLAMAMALVLAVVAGTLLFVVVNALPEGVKLFSFGSDLAPLRFIEDNSRIITLIITGALVGYGIIKISNWIQRKPFTVEH